MRHPNLALDVHVDVPTALGAGDPGSTRLVYVIIAGLVVIGIGLIVLGVWLVRTTRHDPEVLAPLERMGDRDWQRSDPASQQRLLDQVRPEGAEPLSTFAPQPALDADFDRARQQPGSLDDLGPGVPGEGTHTPTGLPAPWSTAAASDADDVVAGETVSAETDPAESAGVEADVVASEGVGTSSAATDGAETDAAGTDAAESGAGQTDLAESDVADSDAADADADARGAGAAAVVDGSDGDEVDAADDASSAAAADSDVDA